MKSRICPRIYLLAAGISAAGFLAPQIARAQVSPPVDYNDEDVTRTDVDTTVQTTRSELRYEGTQTSTGVTALDDDGRPIIQERTYTERKTEVTTTPAPEAATTMPSDTNLYVEENTENRFYGSGIGLEAGGGVNEFANGRIAQMTGTGGAWGARLTVGTRSPLAFEGSYIGTANRIETLGLDRSTLMSNGAEGALKFHLALAELNDTGSVMVKPYLLAGFAWKHYSLRGVSENTSSVEDSDNVFEIPVGLGLGWNFGHFIADQRFDYRPALSGDLVRDLNGGGNTDTGLQTWSLTARVGVEF